MPPALSMTMQANSTTTWTALSANLDAFMGCLLEQSQHRPIGAEIASSMF
jgi:hypothetical protein